MPIKQFLLNAEPLEEAQSATLHMIKEKFKFHTKSF